MVKSTSKKISLHVNSHVFHICFTMFFTMFYHVSPCFTMFHHVLPCFYHVLPIKSVMSQQTSLSSWSFRLSTSSTACPFSAKEWFLILSEDRCKIHSGGDLISSRCWKIYDSLTHDGSSRMVYTKNIIYTNYCIPIPKWSSISTWWFIPLSKWVITLVISVDIAPTYPIEITRVN